MALTIDEMRSEFKRAAEDEEIAKRLLTSIQNSGKHEAIYVAYQAATEALMAKHAFFPTSKYSWCKRAMNDFSTAVKSAPADMEIRYLRLAVEVNLPSMLGMSGDIAEDKNKILQLLPASVNRNLNREVIQLLLSKDLCTASEESALRQIKQ